jgi:DHA1 family multidrug resistance protein-like MFS transporter
MAADEADLEMARNERDASPGRFQDYTATGEPIEREESRASSSSSDSDNSTTRNARPSAGRHASASSGMSRIATAGNIPGDMQRNETAMTRIQTARSQHSVTVGASLKSRQSRKPLPQMGHGKPYPPALPDREEYVVEFEGADDPLHAQNWPLKRKLMTGAMLGYFTFLAAFGSSIFSAATGTVARVYGVGTTTGVLGVSLYVLGFATGPIIWAPFSELRGRRLPLIIGAFGFMIFNFAVAVAKDFQTVTICRFWAGFFGACPLTVVAAVFSDMFDNRTRGLAVSVT